MGNQPVCCCNSDRDGKTEIPTSLDMVNPHQPETYQNLFLNQFSLGSLDCERSIAEDESILDDMKFPSGRGAENSTRMRLLIATRHDDAPGVLQYVADGADIADMGEALRLGAQRGSASVVRELVAVGLSVNDSCPQSGFTPLQLASASGQLSVCELLLDALADVHKSVAGTTALTLARKMGNIEVEEILERHISALALEAEGGEAEDAAQWSRRAHVLPRVSPVLSEAVLQALPSAQQADSTAVEALAPPPKEETDLPKEPESKLLTSGQGLVAPAAGFSDSFEANPEAQSVPTAT